MNISPHISQVKPYFAAISSTLSRCRFMMLSLFSAPLIVWYFPLPSQNASSMPMLTRREVKFSARERNMLSISRYVRSSPTSKISSISRIGAYSA